LIKVHSMDVQALNVLKSLYQGKVDTLADIMTRARAQVALSAWEAAETQYQEILAASATSYSTTGRTVTKRDIEKAMSARNAARADLEGEIGGPDAGVMLVDNGGGVW